MTFAEKYCAENKIERERFREEVMLRVLYPRVLHIRTLLKLIPGYFEPDYELIDGVGRLTDMKGFDNEETDFVRHSGNRGFLRNTLGLRVSVRRLKKLVHSTVGTGQNLS